MPRISNDPDPMIVFNEVSKTFRLRQARSLKRSVMDHLQGRNQVDKFTAVNDLSFAVYPGEAVGLMGKNGSGKSTTLKLLSGVLRPSEGWVRVRGRIAGLLEVGAGFHPELTGRENIYLNASILGMTKKETDDRLDQIVEFSELSGFIDTEVKRYSSGMYARLGFSVAIHTELDVFLVDEVLSVGDADFQAKCAMKINELRSEGKTMFIVSHNAAQLKKLCDRGIVLERGRKVFDGSIDEAVAFLEPRKN